MADKKISELTGAGALTGTEEVPIVQGGVTVKTTTQDIADLGGGSESQITITTTVNISTDTTASGVGQKGKNVIIDNGANNIELTVNGGTDFVASYLKHGSGTITFIQGSGRTLIDVDGETILSGAVGSTATISSVGTTDYLRISNA